MQKYDNIKSENHFLGITNFDYKNMKYDEKKWFHEKLYSFCFGKAIKCLYNEDFAHSVAQDVSFIVTKHIHKYDPKVAKFITWVSFILKREIIKMTKHRDAQKRQTIQVPINVENEDGEMQEENRLLSSDNVEETAIKHILLMKLREASNMLNDRQKKIYDMYFIQEKTLHEIGKVVGLSHEGVRLNIKKIIKHLEDYFIEKNLIGA